MRARALRQSGSHRMQRPASRPEDGSVLVIFAASLTALIAFVAMAIDLGNTAQSHINVQNAADAAALAGATALGHGADKLAAIDAITSSGGIVASYTSGISWMAPAIACNPPAPFVVVNGQTRCIAFFPSKEPSAIWVEIPAQPLPSLISKATSVDVTASSEAIYSTSSGVARLCWGAPGTTGNCQNT